MQVILLKKVPSLGSMGEIKNVKDGYARNFLIPKGLATIPTKKLLEEMERRKKKQEQHEEKKRKEKEEKLENMCKTGLEIPAKMSEEGKLYGSVDPKTILEKLHGANFPWIEKEMIQLKDPIKTAGDRLISLKIRPDKTIDLKIRIIPEK